MSSCLTTKGVLVLRGAPLLLIGDEQTLFRAFPLAWGAIQVHYRMWGFSEGQVPESEEEDTHLLCSKSLMRKG